jgi:hypothetical protein
LLLTNFKETKFLKFLKMTIPGWEHSSVEEYLSSMWKDMGLKSITTKKERKKRKKDH